MSSQYEGLFVLMGIFVTGLALYMFAMAICNKKLNKMGSWINRNRQSRPIPRLPLESTNQDDDVWNISSRVNQQNQDGTPPNWPTHDHRLSMDFVITPEYNIKDTRPPPPPYSELDLPSYEQATGCRPPRADLTPVHQQSDQNRPGPSS
ncbi:uncharacterized protein [Onthophagus taurus]|uniref:uncharacterized protein isoform X6 n=1 Tax=Onthophagus taurus TaxID=166361 RepID=UPI000C1FFC82|nr:uncharacterized protein LOC111415269 isoform X4 [Onthophagus taurus]